MGGNTVIEKEPIFLKVVLVGDAQAGKTQLMSRFVFNEFNTAYDQSICINFEAKSFTDNKGRLFEVQIWDTCGQDNTFVAPYIKELNVIGVVVEASVLFKAAKLSEWINQIKKVVPEIPICLFVNKTDLLTQFDEADRRKIYQKLQVILRESGCDPGKIPIFFCSAKTGSGIKEAFQIIVSSFVENHWEQPYFKLEREISQINHLSIRWHELRDTLSHHKFWVGSNLVLIEGIIIGLIVASCLMGSVFVFGFPLSALAVSAMLGGSILLLWNVACVVGHQFLERWDNRTEQIDHDSDVCWKMFFPSDPEQKTIKTGVSFQSTIIGHQKPEIKNATHQNERLMLK